MVSIQPTCEVWWASPKQVHPGLVDVLDARERERHGRFRRRADADRYLVAHALLRGVCARASGQKPHELTFHYQCRNCADPKPHGKPYPAGPAQGLEVSLTHSGDRVGVALARIEVGLDVEAVAPARDFERLNEYVLTPHEQNTLARLAHEQRCRGFFAYWARKEALLKATGMGLAGGLTSIEVSAPDERARVRSGRGLAAPEAVWLTDLDPGGQHYAALAALTSEPMHVSQQDPSCSSAVLAAL